MKKIYLLLMGVFAFLLFSPNVYAASASVKVKASNNTLVVGSTTKVTVTVSSSDLGAWEYCISYDSSVLKLTSSTADANTCVKAGYVEKKGQTSSSETFTFKAIKSGSSKVTVKSYAIYSYSTETVMNTSASSVTIKTMTQAELEATYSTNANLKSLTVDGYELTPAFDKNTLEYRVEVPNEVTSVNISLTKEDFTAQISGDGLKELTEGDNKFEIIVTAQKGNSKTYVVNVYRKELDPISVKIDNKEYFIVRKTDAIPQYPTFVATTIMYGEDEIPALYSEITDYTLIAVKDEDGNILTFIYRDGEFTRYNEVKSDALTIFPKELPDDDRFSNLTKVSFDYNGYKLEGYQVSENSNYAIIYAQNIETGDIKFYSLDKKNSTIQEYNEELSESYTERMNIMKYIILGFIALTIILLLIIIFRKPKRVVQTVPIREECLDIEQVNKKHKKDKKIKIQEIIPEEDKENTNVIKLIEVESKEESEDEDDINDEEAEGERTLSKREMKKLKKQERKKEKARLKEF